jgi:hypothetical protein
MFNIRLVCEGSTDEIVLKAILFAYLQSPDFTVDTIQPEKSGIQGEPAEHGQAGRVCVAGARWFKLQVAWKQ